MNVLDSGQNLCVQLAGLLLFQSTILDDVLEELSPRAVLHDEVEIVVVFDHLTDIGSVKIH